MRMFVLDILHHTLPSTSYYEVLSRRAIEQNKYLLEYFEKSRAILKTSPTTRHQKLGGNYNWEA